VYATALVSPAIRDLTTVDGEVGARQEVASGEVGIAGHIAAVEVH
jgi:hypothetical protein